MSIYFKENDAHQECPTRDCFMGERLGTAFPLLLWHSHCHYGNGTIGSERAFPLLSFYQITTVSYHPSQKKLKEIFTKFRIHSARNVYTSYHFALVLKKTKMSSGMQKNKSRVSPFTNIPVVKSHISPLKHLHQVL